MLLSNLQFLQNISHKISFPLTLSLITLTLLHSSITNAQKSANISVGQSLTATTNSSSSWISPSGEFAFGFSKLPNTTNLFLLAIWYAQIPNTIIWYANNGYPVPQGSTVKISPDKGLILNDPQGTNLWTTSSELHVTDYVSYGFMNDTGNFALISSPNDNPVWQSFDHPTDTLLPGQTLGSNGVVNSRESETNYTTGRFQMRLTSDGILYFDVLHPNSNYSYPPYYVSDNSNPGQAQKLVYNESGYMFILRKNGSIYNMLPDGNPPSGNFYQRATLRFDGVLTWYLIPKSSISDGWSISNSIPNNICNTGSLQNLGTGICGTNSICTVNDDSLPTCMCPQGYSQVDPSDVYSGCQADFMKDVCEGYEDRVMKGEFKLVKLPSTDFVFNDYDWLDYDNESDCQNACLNDCFCAAVSFQVGGNSHGCWKKKAPLYNGKRGNMTSGSFFIKIGNGNFSSVEDNPFVSIKSKSKELSVIKKLFGGSLSLNVVLLSIFLLFIITYHKRQQRKFDDSQRRKLREYSNIHRFSYQELKEATDNFKEELGRGSFGIVYKGVIKGEGTPVHVAVKKLDRRSGESDKEFKTEVNVIGQTHHKNLVKLTGFCDDDDQRLLAYAFMSNGNLADYIFGEVRPSWKERVVIAQQIARGLLYLHEECSTQIIHCDIKPQNILLDEYHNACISDFGLAKLLILNQTHTNTAIRGTKGYVAPEWFRNKPVTVKVDVYSFGVLLLEIICCRKSVRMELIEEGGAILTDWAFDCYLSNRLDSLVNDDVDALDDMIQLKRLVIVALWCIQEDPSARPTMRMVTQMLEGLVEVPNDPPTPNSFTIASQC